MTEKDVLKVLAEFMDEGMDDAEKRAKYLVVGMEGRLHVVTGRSNIPYYMYERFDHYEKATASAVRVDPTVTHVRLKEVDAFFQDHRRLLRTEPQDERPLISSYRLWKHYFGGVPLDDKRLMEEMQKFRDSFL